ncbi:MAG: glycosyltransferase family 39 protein [Pyrinomonadaceae bacterium]|nr:glycosyltransferase family 39 protein [Pyrinomonadaceae bacterium]
MLKISNNEYKTVVSLFAAAAVLRLLDLFLFSNQLLVDGDQMHYVSLARNLANGDFSGFLHPYWSPLYPLLIAIPSVFIDSLTVPAVIISIIAGSLAPPAIYFFVRQSYDRRIALIAAVLAVFYPHLLNTSVFDVGSESLYLLLITASLFIGWRALQQDSRAAYLGAGIFFALAYLTRPEAFAYPFYFAALAIIKTIKSDRKLGKKIGVNLSVLFLGFFILSAPYLIYLRGETSEWTISAKAKANVASGALSDDALAADEPPGSPIVAILKEIPYSLNEIHKNIPYLIPVFLLLLIGLGLFGSPWTRLRTEREIYMISFCLVTFLGYAATVVQTRYFYVLLPIFFGWIAKGIVELEAWFFRSFSTASPQSEKNSRAFVGVCLAAIFVYVLPANYFINARDLPTEIKDAGIWMKSNGPPKPRIFSVSKLPVFYADGEQIFPKVKTHEGMIDVIRTQCPDFVVTSARSIPRNRFMENFSEVLKGSPIFESVYEKNSGTKTEVSIFRVLNCRNGSAGQ